MRRWPLVSAAVVAGFFAGAIAFPAAQQRVEGNVTVTRIAPGASSEPAPILTSGRGPIEAGGIYEIYFNGPMYVPGMGLRPTLFARAVGKDPDGWYAQHWPD